MVHAPELSQYVRRPTSSQARTLDDVSDAVDAVNVLKGKSVQSVGVSEVNNYDEASKFDSAKDKEGFRKFQEACDGVKKFYAEQHRKQTLEYNLNVRTKFLTQVRARMSVWEAIEMLNTLVDESDPDTSLSQIEHSLQTAEAMRRDGRPEWMQLTGLVHDLGKILCFFGAEGQWDVVGDTFVVGCRYDEKIIYHDTFKANPDYSDPKLNTEHGIYSPNCGLDKVMLSWGHDEYLYNICKNQSTLPKEALSMIRYHSFYPWHREGAYRHLMNESDYEQLKAVQAFNPYDLYSKSDEPPKVEDLKEYYQGLIAKYFPAVVEW